MKKGSQAISAVIITFNEEANLERCLASLDGIFDEIIIIDSGSTDNTIEIANRFGIDPFYQKFLGFGDQKRYAVQAARNDYVFSIDADEELSPELKDAILSIENITDHDAYQINRLSSCDGVWIRHSGWHPDWLIRLWNRKKGNLNRNLVHESVQLLSDATTTRLNGLLLHYTIGSLADHLKRISKYAALKAKRKKRVSGPLISILKGKFKFFNILFLKLGFLDGRIGFQIAAVSALDYLMQYAASKKKLQTDGENMNVCFINSSPFGGGDENWFKDTMLLLNEKGMEVFGIVASGSSFYNELIEANIPVFPFRAKSLSFLNPFKIRSLIRYFNENSTQKVIINGSSDLKCCGLAAWLAGVPDIIYVLGDAKKPQHNALTTFLYASVVTHFLANSKETLNLHLGWMNLPLESFDHKIIHHHANIESYFEGKSS
jgi:glycosyltransferase involved in cell wall biosynthesis